MHKTAVIYARVSTVGQAEEELPLASQMEHCERKAAELGAAVLEVFCDDGLSGRSDSRPSFQDAVLYAEARGVDYFITWSSSRFARNRVDAGFHKRRLEQAGVRLVYCSMEVDTGTDGGWLLDSVMEIFDELYSRQVSADTRRSMIRNAQRGYWSGGRPPYGYEPAPAEDDPKRKRLRPVESEARLVRRIFERRAEGYGARQIAMELNELGITNRGRRWNRTVISYLLRNEAMAGRTVFGRRPAGSVRRQSSQDHWIIVESHPPIVPGALWERVQSMIDVDRDNASLRQNTIHLFTGLLRCGRCGAHLTPTSAKGRSKRYHYYHCRAVEQDRAHDPRRIRADLLDEFLVDLICEDVLSAERMRELARDLSAAVQDWERDRDDRRQAVLASLKDIDNRTSRLYEVLELHGKDAPNLGDLTERLRKHKEQQKRLELDLARIDAEEAPRLEASERDLEELSAMLVDTIKTAQPKKARAFFASFIDHIEITDQEVAVQ